MPDTAEIERRIDKGVASALAIADNTTGAFTIAPKNLGEVMEFAKMMAVSHVAVRKGFRDNPGACLALTLQAFRWGADPFAVANKAYVVNDQIAYEAQLIHAIVNSSGVLVKRLRATFEGDGPSRRCKVIGFIKGEDEPFEYESPPVSVIPVKNSPLWKSDVDQQLIYYSERAWARRYVPEVLLGIYTTDELQGETVDVTPISVLQQAEEPEGEREPSEWFIADHTGHDYTFNRSASAVEALRKILVAVGNNPEQLRTAWENNAGFIDDLKDFDHGAEHDELVRLYKELAPHDIGHVGRLATEAAGTPDEAAAEASGAVQPATSPSSDVSDHDAAGEQQGVGTGAGTQSPPSPIKASQEDPAERSDAESGPGAASDRPFTLTAPYPEGVTQTAEAHDSWWDGKSLKLDPGYVRGSLKPNWKVWPAVMLPRIRQAWSIEMVNQLWEDNHRNIEMYGEAQGQKARDELLDILEARRDELRAA